MEFKMKSGATILVDEKDTDLLIYNWGTAAHGYATTSTRGKQYYMHRVILKRILGRELRKGELTDHINGARLDNRRCNLRSATPSQSMMNRKKQKNRSSQYIGVSYAGQGRKKCWRAYIKVEGKHKNLGYYHTPEEAARIRDEAAGKIYGEFARLNNVDTP